MSKEWDILVASANLEHRRSLIRILEELPVNVISVSTYQQAEVVLSRQHIALVFSDHRLPDGSFRGLLNHVHSAGRTWFSNPRKEPSGLLNHVHSAGRTPPVVLTTGASDSVDPKEMAECGVLGTVRYPFHATDVELQIIRATHEERLEELPAAITH